MLTRDFKKAGQGWHVFSSAFGPVGVAWTAKGVCHLEFGPLDEEAVIADILAAYPDMRQARPIPQPVKAIARRLKAHLAGKLDPMLDIPVDLSRGSEFSKRVLDALRKIKPGEVATYGQLAARAGRPKAARAVGRIMGANPVPIIVPCHRCVGSDGSMTGFSTEGGIVLKKKLLFMEGYEPNENYAAGIAHLQRKDPVMKRLIGAVGPFSPLPDKPSPAYDALIRAIIHQQLSVKAGRTIDGRVRDLTDGSRFPRPEEMMTFDDATLRAAGLSTQKTGYVKDLAARVSNGRLKLGRLKNMSDEEVITELTTVRGIGVWSAHMHLIFHLGRLDVLPIGDLGIQIACGKFYDLGKYATPGQIETLGERWRPYRSMASWYLWRGLDAGGL